MTDRPMSQAVRDYRQSVLDSADADGRLDPPTLQDWWAQQSLMIGMYMEGLIEKRGTGPMWNRTGPWYLPATAIRNTAAGHPGPTSGESPGPSTKG